MTPYSNFIYFGLLLYLVLPTLALCLGPAAALMR